MPLSSTALAVSAPQLCSKPLQRPRWQRHQQQRQRQQERHVMVRAAAAPEPGQQPGGPLSELARGAQRVLERYDFLSAGLGAMVVTGFCAARGQDLSTALWITAASTVVAILVNDMLPEEH